MGSGEALPRRTAPGHARDEEPQAGLRFRQEAVEAEGYWTRPHRFGALALWRHGGTVHGPQPRSYDYAFPKKKLLGALRAALAAKLSDGKLTVVESLELGQPKTKAYRAALNAVDAKRTALIVENSQSLSPSLILGVRNLEGVELLLNNEVHPYDLLRYDRAIFSRAALEQLQETLKKTVSKRKQREKAGVA